MQLVVCFTSYTQSRHAINRSSPPTRESWPGRLASTAVFYSFLPILFAFGARLWSNHDIAVPDSDNVSHGRITVREFTQCVLVQPIHCKQPTQHDKNHDYHSNISLFPCDSTVSGCQISEYVLITSKCDYAGTENRNSLQYGASEAGYRAMPQNVYKQVEHAFIAYSMTDRAASSPPRWVIILAQP